MQSLALYQGLVAEIKAKITPFFFEHVPQGLSETEAMAWMAKHYSPYLESMYAINDSCDAVTHKLLEIWTGQKSEPPQKIAPLMMEISPAVTHPTPSFDEPSLDAEARGLVEDSWRTFLTLAAKGQKNAAADAIGGFEPKMVDYSVRMGGAKSKRFLELIEIHRAKLADEYARSPETLKRSLGLAGGAKSRAVAPQGKYGDLEKLAVRTAVRAGVWRTIWSIFR